MFPQMADIRIRLLRGQTNHRAELPGTAVDRHQQARRQPHQSAVKGEASRSKSRTFPTKQDTNCRYIAGHPRHAPVHAHLQLVVGQRVLPHDHRQSGARLQAAVRHPARLQDGRPAHVVHRPDAHQHEQAADNSNKLMAHARRRWLDITYEILI